MSQMGYVRYMLVSGPHNISRHRRLKAAKLAAARLIADGQYRVIDIHHFWNGQEWQLIGAVYLDGDKIVWSPV